MCLLPPSSLHEGMEEPSSLRDGIETDQVKAHGSVVKNRSRARCFVSAAFVILIGLAGWAADDVYHLNLASRELDKAGYGEHVMRGTWQQRCWTGSKATLFLAQGGRVGREIKGYVCTSYFRGSSIHELPLSEPIGLDWD